MYSKCNIPSTSDRLYPKPPNKIKTYGQRYDKLPTEKYPKHLERIAKGHLTEAFEKASSQSTHDGSGCSIRSTAIELLTQKLLGDMPDYLKKIDATDVYSGTNLISSIKNMARLPCDVL